MKAAVFHKPRNIECNEVPDPKILESGDVILKVTSTAICGSDLHIYNGYFPQVNDLVMGHEFMGIVEEAGKDVKNFQKGDRVIAPFVISCGHCWFCTHHLEDHCENSNIEHYGPEGGILEQKGGGLYGYTDLYGGYPGGQAEYVRVRYADYCLRHAPDLEDEKVLFLTDILPTGYSGIDWAGVKGGESVAVFGCGPVGLMTMKVARLRGAEKIIGLDIEPYRLKKAKETTGCETILVEDAKQAVEAVRSMTGGRGADVVVDAVGMEADRTFLQSLTNIIHVQAGTINALKMAFSAVRRGGFVSVLGVYATTYDNFPFGQMFDKGFTVRAGQATVYDYIDELTDLVKNEKIITDDIITHKLPLTEVEHAYKIFANKEDDCVKVILKP
jgi:alcohol dehydrogenase